MSSPLHPVTYNTYFNTLIDMYCDKKHQRIMYILLNGLAEIKKKKKSYSGAPTFISKTVSDHILHGGTNLICNLVDFIHTISIFPGLDNSNPVLQKYLFILNRLAI